MNNNSLKTKATHGMLWITVEKIFMYSGQFIIGIILARLLLPKDFGLIGMLAVFIALSQVFIDSGMERALIQKKNRTEIDFSTVFIFNFTVSVFVYIILFFLAPVIASFYKTPELVNLTRVLMISIIINSLSIVQKAKLTIVLDFRLLARINVIAVIVGGVAGILFALSGAGVWALVLQNLITRTVAVLQYWYSDKSKSSINFSKKSFKELFSFSSKLLIAGIIANIMGNLYDIIIGRFYSSVKLGYYTQSKKLIDISSSLVSEVVNRVSFPILASLNNNQTKMLSVYTRIIKMTSFIIFPVMTLIALLADPIVRILFNDNWLPVIPFLQIMPFARLFYPIDIINMNVLNAHGRSDLFLKVDIIKIPITITSLLITIPFGLKAMVIGFVISSNISFFVNAYMPGKLFGYGIFRQLKDMIPFFFATAIMALIVKITIIYLNNSYLQLFGGGFVGIISYLMITSLLKTPEFYELKRLVLKGIKKIV